MTLSCPFFLVAGVNHQRGEPFSLGYLYGSYVLGFSLVYPFSFEVPEMIYYTFGAMIGAWAGIIFLYTNGALAALNWAIALGCSALFLIVLGYHHAAKSRSK